MPRAGHSTPRRTNSTSCRGADLVFDPMAWFFRLDENVAAGNSCTLVGVARRSVPILLTIVAACGHGSSGGASSPPPPLDDDPPTLGAVTAALPVACPG